MEPPKFRIKKVGEDYPAEPATQEPQVDDINSTLNSINEKTHHNEELIPSLEEVHNCINCEHELKPDTVICIECGTNQSTGKGLKTKSVKQKQKKFKQKSMKTKKPMDAWLVNFIIFIVIAYPIHSFLTSIKERMDTPEKLKYACEESLLKYHSKIKSPSAYSCHMGASKNFKLYKPASKEQSLSPKFVKAYCDVHKHGVNLKGEIIEVREPFGKKVSVPEHFKLTQASADNVAMGFTLLFWGVILNLTSRISFCYYAFKESFATLLCCFIIPFYSLFFWLRNRENIGPSFTCGIISALMILLGLICTISGIIN